MATVGIDLGTTNSVVAILDGAQARVLDNRDAKSQTRSVVGIRLKKDKEPELLVGDAAIKNWPMAPKDTINSIKRLMGRSIADEEVVKAKNAVQYDIITPSDGTKDGIRVKMGGKEYSPIEISAEILKNLKAYAEFRLHQPVTDAVITVPAYFSQVQRDATRQAGKKAGLNVLKILDEPTAAAIAFGVDSSGCTDPKHLLVYDLGGGTFDISILLWAANVFVPITVQGDMWLGGDDFDRVIIDKVVEEVNGKYQIDCRSKHKFMVRLKIAAQEAKERLTNANSADIIIDNAFFDNDKNSVDVISEISIEEFESLIKKYVDRSVEITKRALQNAFGEYEEIKKGEKRIEDMIDYVVMAGNTTCVPMVQREMEKMFGKDKVQRKMHAKHCVAQGAAIAAANTPRGTECLAPDPLDAKRVCGHMNKIDATKCERCGALKEIDAPNKQSDKIKCNSPDPNNSNKVCGFMNSIDASICEKCGNIIIATIRGIAPFHYGIQSKGDKFNLYIKKGDDYETPDEKKVTLTFYTHIPNQRVSSYPVYGGENTEKASLNEKQGEAFSVLPANLPIGTPLLIKLWLDSDGVFDLTAHLENGEDLKPWIIKGGVDAKLIEHLEAVDIIIADKVPNISPDEAKSLESARNMVLKELKNKNFEQAQKNVEAFQKIAENVGERGDSPLPPIEIAKGIARFANVILQEYGWVMSANQSYSFSKIVKELENAIASGSEEIIDQKLNEMYKALENLPTAINVFLNDRGVINGRIQPADPALAAQLLEEMDEFEKAVRSKEPNIREKQEKIENKIEKAIKNIEKNKPGKCVGCSAELKGQRCCPQCGYDSWIVSHERSGGSGYSTHHSR